MAKYQRCDWLAAAPTKLDVWSLTNVKIWWTPNNDHLTNPLPCSVSGHVQEQWSHELSETYKDSVVYINMFYY